MIVNLKNGGQDYLERTETLTRYYDDIKRFPLLTPEQETELFNKYNNGTAEEKNEARIALANSNQRIVVSIARKFANSKNLMDLISEGNIGLLMAIDRFDASVGAKFATFAVWYIRRSINEYSIKYNAVVRKSNLAKTYHIIAQIKNKFMQEEYRQPTMDEIADILRRDYNVDIKTITDLLDTKFISIEDASTKSEDNANIGDYIQYSKKSARVNEVEKIHESDFNQVMVNSLLNKLPSREKTILQMLFGIDCDREYELQEVAEKLNLTSERVRQLRISALAKLKKIYQRKSINA